MAWVVDTCLLIEVAEADPSFGVASATLIDSKRTDGLTVCQVTIVTELYLATLNRPPTDEKLKLGVGAFTAEKATRQTVTEEVFWALLNSAKFVFNH